MTKSKFFAINGMTETEIEADSIELRCEDGRVFELHPRKSDGEIILSAKRRLVIYPQAANCCRIDGDA